MKRGGGGHTVPIKGLRLWWQNKLDGEVVTVSRRKKDAVRYGRALAKGFEVEHTTHRRDGVITEKNSYGKDAYPPKG